MTSPTARPPLCPPEAGRSVPWWALDLFALTIALSLGAALWLAGATLDPTARDQVHDLSLAIRIREWRSLSDGNRHPLFPGLLAPFAGRDPAFQTRALVAGIVVTVAAAFAIYRSASSIYSRALGVVTLVLLLIELRLQGRRICPEPLLAGLLIVGVAVLARARGSLRPVRTTFVAGAVFGLAWLTKGSATLALAAAMVHVLASGDGRGRRVGALLLGFALAASPLIVWNVSQGHGPLFNVNSAHVMWEEGWDGDLDKRSVATPATWWAAHSVGEGVTRLGRGLVGQRGIEWAYGALVVLGAEAWRRRRAARGLEGATGATVVDADTFARPLAPDDGPRRAWASLAVWNAAIWLLAFAWYAPIVSSRRLLFPIFPLLLPPVLDAVGGWVGAWGRWRAWSRGRIVVAARRWAYPAVVVGIVGVFGYGFGLLALGGAPSSRVPIAPVWLEAVEAMRKFCPKGSRVLVRPSRTYPPDWLLEGEVEYVELPSAVRDEDVPAWLGANVEFVLQNEGMLLARPILRSVRRIGQDRGGDAASKTRDSRAVDRGGRLVRVADLGFGR